MAVEAVDLSIGNKHVEYSLSPGPSRPNKNVTAERRRGTSECFLNYAATLTSDVPLSKSPSDLLGSLRQSAT